VKILPLLLAAALVADLARRWGRASDARRAGTALAVGALVAYGAGLVNPPSLEEAVRSLGEALGAWTYLLVGVLAFLETGAFVGLLAPGETAILVGGVVAGQGRIDVWILMALVWAAAVAGDVTSYLLGRRLGRGFLLRHGPKVKITAERLEQVERFYDQHGGKAILLGRFIGLVRAVSPFIAGASRLPFGRFLPYDVIGAGSWGCAYVLLGYVFWRSFDRVTEIAGRGAFILGTVIVLVLAFRWLRRPGNRAAVDSWLDAQEHRPGVGPLVRSARAVDRRVVRPLAAVLAIPIRFVWERLTPGELGLELTTLLAVALVGGFAFGGSAAVLETRRTLPFDRAAVDAVAEMRVHDLTSAVKVVTDLGSLPAVGAVVAIAVGWLAVRRRALEALALAVAMPLTVAAVHIAKDAVERARPPDGLVRTEGSSYPSGHAAYAVALVAVAVVLARAGPGWARRVTLVTAALVAAAAIGLSRVYLNAHYLSDVVGGWALGAAIFALVGIAGLLVAFVRDNGGRT
jgi:membrane protein DedA with SNARE-associated domain/membrane-associated phospholipid phosphatase